MNIEQYGIYFLYTLIYIAAAVILKYVLNIKSSSDYSADEQLAEGNLAVGLRRTGAQFGLAVAMMGVLSSGSSANLMEDLIATGLYSLVAIFFIMSSLFITDKLVLPGINNQEQLKQGNTSVGVVELGMLVATGIISYSSIVGQGGGVLSSLSYFVAGQLTLVALVLFYERVILRNIDIVKSVGNNNISAGIYLGGKLIAYALILKSAIAGNLLNVSITDLMIEFFVLSLTGMALLYVFERIIDVVILTSSTVSTIIEGNKVALALQLASAKIGMALILSNAIL